MNRRIGIGLCAVGILFLVNAIFGRYIVLPGYFQSLEAGTSAASVPENVPILKVVRYLVWAYSYKLGIYFFVLGAMSYSRREKRDRLLFLLIGFIYIGFAYMDLPFDSSLFFGIGGAILTLALLYLFSNMNVARADRTETGRILFLNLGYYFLAMAAYNLCPLLGVKCFALQPEKMILYGLQSQAASFSNHIMIELVLGFLCICVYRVSHTFSPRAPKHR
jgi:hypothetical protein